MVRLLGVALVVLALATDAMAQSYPARPVKLIVPFPPGGNTDIVGRLIAQKLSEGFGQQVYVENRGGAGGTIGAEAAAKSPNDGYTLFFSTTGTLASAPSMQPNLRYDPIKDFAPITTLANAPVVVIVAAGLPAKTLRELIAAGEGAARRAQVRLRRHRPFRAHRRRDVQGRGAVSTCCTCPTRAWRRR